MDGAALIDCSKEDLISWSLLDRFRLPCQRAFVEKGLPKGNDTVGWGRGPLAYEHDVSDLQNRCVNLSSLRPDPREEFVSFETSLFHVDG